jgi:hypothetical protein
VLVYQYRYDYIPPQPEITRACILALIVATIFFLLCELIFLRILGIAAPTIKVLAGIVYALTPFIPILCAYYIASYFSTGRFGISYYFITGKAVAGDWFIKFFPFFWRFANFCSVLVFANALRVIGPTSLFSGLLVSVLSIGVVIVSLFLGVITANAIYPETYAIVWKWILYFGTVSQ